MDWNNLKVKSSQEALHIKRIGNIITVRIHRLDRPPLKLKGKNKSHHAGWMQIIGTCTQHQNGRNGNAENYHAKQTNKFNIK